MTQSDPGSLPPTMPVPVQALPYSIPASSGRPGLIIAIAVLCIIVGCISGMVSFFSGLEAVGFFVASKFSTMSARSATVVASPTASSAGSTGLPPADTAVATNELSHELSLSGAYVRELNKLLRSHGREIFGVDEDTSVTAASVRSAVTESSPPGQDGAPAHFVTVAGRVDLYPDRAVFTSADGSATEQTSAVNGTDATSQPSVASQSTGSATAVTPAQITQALNTIQQTYGVKLTPQQTAAIRTALSAPNQQLVTPGNTMPVLSANRQPNGNVMVQFDSGMISMGPQGQVLFQSSNTFGPGSMMHIKGTTFAMIEVDAVGSVALAIYIFVLGILLFRMSSRMPRLLRIYALLKIPLAILAGIAWPLMVYEIAASSGATGSSANWAYFIWGGTVTVLGCAFPIGLLIALRAKSVREYFSPVVR